MHTAAEIFAVKRGAMCVGWYLRQLCLSCQCVFFQAGSFYGKTGRQTIVDVILSSSFFIILWQSFNDLQDNFLISSNRAQKETCATKKSLSSVSFHRRDILSKQSLRLPDHLHKSAKVRIKAMKGKS